MSKRLNKIGDIHLRRPNPELILIKRQERESLKSVLSGNKPEKRNSVMAYRHATPRPAVDSGVINLSAEKRARMAETLKNEEQNSLMEEIYGNEIESVLNPFEKKSFIEKMRMPPHGFHRHVPGDRQKSIKKRDQKMDRAQKMAA